MCITTNFVTIKYMINRLLATNLGCLYVREKVNFEFQLNLLLPKLKSFGMIRQETELITFEHAQCSS